jgi:hypothetical protein
MSDDIHKNIIELKEEVSLKRQTYENRRGDQLTRFMKLVQKKDLPEITIIAAGGEDRHSYPITFTGDYRSILTLIHGIESSGQFTSINELWMKRSGEKVECKIDFNPE